LHARPLKCETLWTLSENEEAFEWSPFSQQGTEINTEFDLFLIGESNV